MDQLLSDAADVLGIRADLANLEEAAGEAKAKTDGFRQALSTLDLSGEAIDVVVFGSLARQEATIKSDVDFLVLIHDYNCSPSAPLRLITTTNKTIEDFGLELPGSTGMFGTTIAAADMIARIGLDADTNLTHSRRVLLLTESSSVLRPDLHRQLRVAILKRYLEGYETPKNGPPRFLLNDLARYWRTVAVDYQAKVWSTGRDRWGLRYLKLVTSRKLSYAAALVPVLTCTQTDPERLAEAYERPALARLASLALDDEFDQRDALAECLKIGDRFVGRLASKEFRDAANSVQRSEGFGDDQDVAAARDDARALQMALEKVFFESAPLAELSQRYLSF